MTCNQTACSHFLEINALPPVCNKQGHLQVKTAEGFSKRELFQKLAPLEEATRPLMAQARKALVHTKGQSAVQPWNISYSLSGEICSGGHS